MGGRLRTKPLRIGLAFDSTVRTHWRCDPNRQLRRLAQDAGVPHVELCQPSLCTLKLVFGFAPAAGGPQQSNQRRLDRFVGGFKETECPRVAEGLVGLVLKTGYQRQQQSHPKPACLLALANAPALKFVAVGKIGALEEINLKRLRRLPQGIG